MKRPAFRRKDRLLVLLALAAVLGLGVSAHFRVDEAGRRQGVLQEQVNVVTGAQASFAGRLDARLAPLDARLAPLEAAEASPPRRALTIETEIGYRLRTQDVVAFIQSAMQRYGQPPWPSWTKPSCEEVWLRFGPPAGPEEPGEQIGCIANIVIEARELLLAKEEIG